MSKIAVISDLHMGLGDSTDQFGHDIYEFIRFLKYLEDNFEQIILLGDIWETLMSKWGNAKQSLFHSIKIYQDIFKRFQSKKYVYIHGNHDVITSKVFHTPEQHTITVDNQKILFIHGHQWDLLQGNLNFLSELGVWFGGWLLRIKCGNLYRGFADLDISSSLDNLGINKIQKGVSKFSNTIDADIIVCGHTHIGSIIEHKNKLFMNSGTCSNGKYSFLSIDTKAGSYQLKTSW